MPEHQASLSRQTEQTMKAHYLLVLAMVFLCATSSQDRGQLDRSHCLSICRANEQRVWEERTIKLSHMYLGLIFAIIYADLLFHDLTVYPSMHHV